MKDGFVGTMKGVIWGINPEVNIVDITHEISPQSIDEAAFVLLTSYRFFPPRTVHIVIVDPGVGSERRILGVRASGYTFLAPDNSVLKYIFFHHSDCEVFSITNNKYFLPKISRTFHGRDIFAPAAAYLAKEVPLEDMGEKIQEYDRGGIKLPQKSSHKIEGEIIYFDHFGNAITNIREEDLEMYDNFQKIEIDGDVLLITCLSDSYENGMDNKPLAIVGSSGFVEIVLKNADIKKQYHFKLNKKITIEY